MARTYDLLVVGGGVVGLSTAYYAALKGASVGILERGAAGQDCASASAGWLVPSYCRPLTTPHNLLRGLDSLVHRDSAVRLRPRLSPRLAGWAARFVRHSLTPAWIEQAETLLAQLHRESFKLHGELADCAQGAYQFRPGGALYLYLKQRPWRAGCRDARDLARYGIASTPLSLPDLNKREPALGPGVVGAIHYPGDAWLAPRAFMLWLAREAQALGVEIHHHCEAYRLVRQGGRVTSIETTQGSLESDQVLLATGAWLPELSAQVGRRLPLEPAKGYSVTFRPSGPLPNLPLELEEQGAVVVPYADRLRVIFGLEFAGLDLSFDSRRLARIPGLAREYLPATQWGPPTEIRRGLRPVSPDGLPVMGRLRGASNLFVAGGHDQKGLSLGPATGFRLARLLAGEAPDDLDARLSPQRFNFPPSSANRILVKR